MVCRRVFPLSALAGALAECRLSDTGRSVGPLYELNGLIRETRSGLALDLIIAQVRVIEELGVASS